MIPLAALERGERAFVSVLRRRYPDAAFVLRDRTVSPEDADASGEVAASASADLDTIEEPGDDLAPLNRVEALPKLRKGASRRNPRQAGR